jgi:hypothetical protein
MHDARSNDAWIHRFAQRLKHRHAIPRPHALDLATEALTLYGLQACPERAADVLFEMPTWQRPVRAERRMAATLQ